MRIGILTFHWAANYGAVLQAWALKETLAGLGHEVRVVDYVPAGFLSVCVEHARRLVKVGLPMEVSALLRNRKLRIFRKRRLALTGKYRSSRGLRERAPDCEAFICGSDQVWNAWFAERGEGEPTFSYFLDFAPAGSRKISYAASFGASEYPDGLKREIAPLLRRFHRLSARETDGARILDAMGFPRALVVPDPVLLMGAEGLRALLREKRPGRARAGGVFFFMLHEGQKAILNLYEAARNEGAVPVTCNLRARIARQGLEEWLETISGSDLVVTNSYHCIACAVLLHRKFLAVPVEGAGSGMNNRLRTLVETYDLESRVARGDGFAEIRRGLSSEIDWSLVDKELQINRLAGMSFLEEALA
ncbi:MAG: polysaccharide pyruvyl transferase family protein [Spirochaetales bacterium]|nr:polysaccharide pyruvyl transferase family protein [Spirochaetales bacterium]